ncbi:MAG: FAD-dependent oxidoreductase, partial [Paracoccus sp. (in: a-proteobacteria)]|nr:FAD-dependent oxidoreductase [Paracoccus sp. (in: a-proteobacteria)]
MPLPLQTDQCDVAIIGAGTAGLAAERAARAQGASTRLIDPRFEGTLCATAGCMPAKLMIAAAQAAHQSRQAGMFGIITGPVVVDTARVMDRVRRERDRFARLTREGFGKLPAGVCLRAK